MLVDFLKIVVILRAKWALQGSRVEGSRARALFGPEPARAQARLVQTLVIVMTCPAEEGGARTHYGE